MGAVLAPRWLDPALNVLESQLESVPYLLGSAFTVADLNVCTLFFRPAVARVDLEPFAAIRAWLGRCTARAAFLRMEERTEQKAEERTRELLSEAEAGSE
jgi:glutathione S-transferase